MGISFCARLCVSVTHRDKVCECVCVCVCVCVFPVTGLLKAENLPVRVQWGGLVQMPRTGTQMTVR